MGGIASSHGPWPYRGPFPGPTLTPGANERRGLVDFLSISTLTLNVMGHDPYLPNDFAVEFNKLLRPFGPTPPLECNSNTQPDITPLKHGDCPPGHQQQGGDRSK